MGNVILIVEDNEMNLTLIRDLLQMSGYATLEARDGKQAVTIAQKKFPDLQGKRIGISWFGESEKFRINRKKLKSDESVRFFLSKWQD